MKRFINAALTTLLLAGAVAVYAALSYQARHKQEATQIPQVATGTEATTTALVEQDIQETPAPSKSEITTRTIYVPVPIPQPAPEQKATTIEITNGVRNEGTVNVYAAAAAPMQEQTAQDTFVEPRQMTPLEIATEIVKLYDSSGTATMVNEGMVQVRLFGGKSVSADITTGWEERLKATLNRIKR